MKTAKNALKPTRVIPASTSTRAKLKAFGKSLKGKDLFPTSNKRAEIILGNCKQFVKT